MKTDPKKCQKHTNKNKNKYNACLNQCHIMVKNEHAPKIPNQ